MSLRSSTYRTSCIEEKARLFKSTFAQPATVWAFTLPRIRGAICGKVMSCSVRGRVSWKAKSITQVSVEKWALSGLHLSIYMFKNGVHVPGLLFPFINRIGNSSTSEGVSSLLKSLPFL
jgi:hypothetical protein